LALDDTEEEESDCEAEVPALGGLENDPIRAERFVIRNLPRQQMVSVQVRSYCRSSTVELLPKQFSSRNISIDLAESLQRSDAPLMITRLPIIDAIVRLDGESSMLLQNAGFARLTEYVREVPRPDDTPASEPIFVAFGTNTKRCPQVIVTIGV
jgi:hypothetical protein